MATAAAATLKFVFVESNSELGQKYFNKFSTVLISLGYIVQNISIDLISTLNTDPSFYYKRIIICHNPTIVDCLKQFTLKGKDVVVQFMLDENLTGPIKKWHWPYYQTVNNLSKLYTNVFGLDISQDVGVNVTKERILTHSSNIYRICGGGFNLNTNMKLNWFQPYTDKEIADLIFEVGLIIPHKQDEQYESVRKTLLKRYGKRFTLINDLQKIRKCKLLVLTTSEMEKNLCIYPDEFYDLILYNVPIITDLCCPPFKDALNGLIFKNDSDICMITNFVSNKYKEFVGVNNDLIKIYSGWANLNVQTANFAQWLQNSIVNKLFNVDPIINKISHVKSSFVLSSYKRDLKTIVDYIYIVNLDKDVERRKKVVAMMAKHGIDDYEIFNAVDGEEHKDTLSNIQLKHIDSGVDKTDDHILSNTGELGCLLSHLTILQDAKERKFKSVLIFEDDVILANDFVNRFLQSYNNLSKAWDMLYLGVSKKDYYTYESTYSQGFIRSNHCFGTFAYAVHSNIYDVLINVISGLLKPLDVYYSKDITSRDEVVAIICQPLLAISDTSTSRIRESIKLTDAARKYGWNLRDFDIDYTSNLVETEKPVVIHQNVVTNYQTSVVEYAEHMNEFVVLLWNTGVEIVIAQDYDQEKVTFFNVENLEDIIKVLKGVYGNKIVMVLNNVKSFRDEKLLLRINNCYSGDNGEKVMGTYGCNSASEDCPISVKVFNRYRNIEWIFSGVHTFRLKLWKDVKEIDMKNSEGEYWNWSVADRAYIYPMLELSHGNFVRVDGDLVEWKDDIVDIDKSELSEIKSLPVYDSE